MCSTFRKAAEADLPGIMEIIAKAQAYLAAKGVDQWQDGYPDEAVMLDDIRLGRGYVLEKDGNVLAIATLVFGGEPSYARIYDGQWRTAEPYACVHRVAVNAAYRGQGLADELMRGVDEEILRHGMHSVRIDTHHDNLSMQRMLQRNGYVPCGVIYLDRDGAQGPRRMALEKTIG